METDECHTKPFLPRKWPPVGVDSDVERREIVHWNTAVGWAYMSAGWLHIAVVAGRCLPHTAERFGAVVLETVATVVAAVAAVGAQSARKHSSDLSSAPAPFAPAADGVVVVAGGVGAAAAAAGTANLVVGIE